MPEGVEAWARARQLLRHSMVLAQYHCVMAHRRVPIDRTVVTEVQSVSVFLV